MEPKQVQALLIQYIVDMRDKMKLAPNSMKVRLAAVKTFLQLNDFEGVNVYSRRILLWFYEKGPPERLH